MIFFLFSRVEISHVLDRFSVILISKNSACVPLCFFSQTNNQLPGFVKQQGVLYDPLCKSIASAPIRTLIVCNLADGGVQTSQQSSLYIWDCSLGFSV